MTDLPPGWAHVRLDEIAEVRLGRQRSPKNHSGSHMRSYLRAANVGWDGLKLDDVKQMNFTEGEAQIYRLRPGDIVLSEASGSPGEVGKPALWNGEIEDCCFQNTLIRVRSNGPDPKFLLLLLRYEALRGAFVEHSRGVGIHHLGAARLSSWPINLPPLAEQRRIVASLEDHLSRLDVGTRNTHRAASMIAQLKRAIYDDIASGHAISGHKGASGLADGWAWVSPAALTSGEAGDITIGPFGSNLKVSDYTPTGVPLVFVRNIRSGIFDGPGTKFVCAEKAAELHTHEVRYGDVLITKMGDPPGDACIYSSETPGIITADCIRVRPDETWDPRLLAIAINSRLVKSQIEQITRGVAQRKVSLGRFRSEIRIPVPPPSLQTEIVQQADRLLSLAGQLNVSLASVDKQQEALRKSLLTDAFSGRLNIQNSRDEPASALLERIRRERINGRQTKAQRTIRTATKVPQKETLL